MVRTGTNPAKKGLHVDPPKTVRVIIPVWLDDLNGYHRHGIDVLAVMLDSLTASPDDRLVISVIDNGSNPKVRGELELLCDNHGVDRLIRNRTNQGKVDALISEMRATAEPVVVCCDADAYFRPGWLNGTLNTLAAFPECGLLSLHPSPQVRWHASSSMMLGAKTSGAKKARAKVIDPKDKERFGRSIGRTIEPSPEAGELIVYRGQYAMLFGFSHFAFAIRREAIGSLPTKQSLSTRDGVDVNFFELPANYAGWWCGSVLWAQVHHIGNSIDEEEKEIIEQFVSEPCTDPVSTFTSVAKHRKISRMPKIVHRATEKLARKAWNNPAVLSQIASKRSFRRVPGSASRLLETDE